METNSMERVFEVMGRVFDMEAARMERLRKVTKKNNR